MLWFGVRREVPPLLLGVCDSVAALTRKPIPKQVKTQAESKTVLGPTSRIARTVDKVGQAAWTALRDAALSTALRVW